jgi:L-histidine N-alpha-methyltransferase
MTATCRMFAADIRAGLCKPGQKELPSKYLYDDVGSKLFEVICDLPEYGLTRADERLLHTHADHIAALMPADLAVAELGSGSGRKTRCILESLSRRRRISYYPIEISHSALMQCERELADLDAITIVGFEREYLDGLLQVAARREDGQRILVLFLGSTIGNFDHPADLNFLKEIRMILAPGDFLLLGTDLAKPIEQLVAAYDDGLGVTAAFNLNLLVRINRELDGEFKIDQFEHVAKFNEVTQSIEMHIRSKCDQVVRIAQANLCVNFSEGETIWTESSHKFSLDEIAWTAQASGFQLNAQWIDSEWPFAENLLVAGNVE